MDALKIACDIVGSQRALAKLIGVSAPYVSQMVAGIRPVPAERVLSIEAATDFRVSRHDLRPDIYPREPWCQCKACERRRAIEETG